MLANIIAYGYEDDARHQIDLEVTQAGSDLVMVIRDDGIAFDPFSDDPPDTQAPVEERPIGGLGCHLVKNLMDDCSYRREQGFNIATLRKQLQS